MANVKTVPKKRKIKRCKQDVIYDTVLFIVLTLILVIVAYPLWWVIISSFSNPTEVSAGNVIWLPIGFNLKGYAEVFKDDMIVRSFLNSILYTVCGVLVNLAVTLPTAYALSRDKFSGKGIITIFYVITMFFSGGMIPTYLVVRDLHLLNTMWSLILPAAVDVYFVFLLRQAFVAVPEALSEAARIDGCSHFTIYRRIILPLCMPQVSTMLLFSFVWSWNDYMGPYLYISDINKQMISVGIKLFASGLAQDYGAQMAGATLVLIPVIVAFFLCQKYFVEGITAGAVKG